MTNALIALVLLGAVLLICYGLGMMWALLGIVARCIGDGIGWMADREHTSK